MEYVYAALLLHKAKQPVNEENVKKVVSAAGVTPDDIQVKALVSALGEINIDDALKNAAATPMMAAAPCDSFRACCGKACGRKEGREKGRRSSRRAFQSLRLIPKVRTLFGSGFRSGLIFSGCEYFAVELSQKEEVEKHPPQW